MKSVASILALSILLLIPMSSSATDKYSGTPATRAEFDQAQQEMRPGSYDKAIASLRKIIQRDPNFTPAYGALLFAQFMQITYSGQAATQDEKNALAEKLHDHIMAKYKTLAKEHPHNPVYPWVIAQLYNEANPEIQEEYCRKSVEVASDFTPGYQCLAGIAMLRGDSVHGAEYFRKVLAANANNPDMWLQYLYFVQADPQEFRKAAYEVGKKFPNTSQAADALFRYADAQTDPAQREQAMEDVVAHYSPAHFDSSAMAENELFGDYDKTDPAKARALAHTMQKELPDSGQWKRNVTYADAMAKAEELLTSGDPAAAQAILVKAKLPGPTFDNARLLVLQSRARLASGDAKGAYSSLLAEVASHPEDETLHALYLCGKQAGKNQQQVDDDLWKLRSADAKPAIPFSLPSFLTGKPVSLTDYRGHVVIVDFFYPNCGPCMHSFPYLQNVLEKFKDKGVVVLAINAIEGQASFVLPLLKSKRVGFIPLRGNAKWCNDVYHVRSFPNTFLIGPDGKVYFRPHLYNHDQQRTAELEVEALLKAAGSTRPATK